MIRHLYTGLLYLLLPVALLRMLWRSRRAPAYRSRWRERFGVFPAGPVPRSLWVHAVSMGEVQAAAPLIRRMQHLYPSWPLVVTTTTPTGSQRVRQLFGDDVLHSYFPYDIPRFICRFLDSVSPDLLVLIETEIWPNLLWCCNRGGIPTVLANARLSERSAAGYRRFGRFGRETINRFTLIAAQSESDAKRFLSLGVDSGRIRVTGSVKFDIKIPAIVLEQAQVLRRYWGIDRPVWVAASTHDGEEEQVLAAHRTILRDLPQALLVLVPRHPERFDRVAALIEREGFELQRRSENRADACGFTVFLGDSMGELAVFLGAADAAFVGGSLVRHGGHNVLEPAALGVAVAFGPHMFNFAEISRMLLAEDAALQVGSGAELAGVMARWLLDASERARIGENARNVVLRNRGALDRLLALIDSSWSHRESNP